LTAFAMDKTKKEIIQKLSDLRRLARRMGKPISPRLTNTVLATIGFNKKSDQALLRWLHDIERTRFQCLLSMPIKEVHPTPGLSSWSDDGIDKFKTFLKLLTWGHVGEGVKTDHISKRMRDTFEGNIRRAHSGKFRMQVEHDVLNSLAFRSLRSVHSVRLLFWFHQKVKLEKNKFKRGSNRWTILDGGITFTYQEGELRGMNRKYFAKSLRELVSLGFIDIERQGSKERHDASIYKISDRWREFEKGGLARSSPSSPFSSSNSTSHGGVK